MSGVVIVLLYVVSLPVGKRKKYNHLFKMLYGIRWKNRE